jgi:hypothetical protein
MKLLIEIINLIFIILLNAIVIAHQSEKDLTKKIPDVKDKGLWSEYGKHGFIHDLE